MQYLIEQLDEEIEVFGEVWEENPTLSALKAARDFIAQVQEACNAS